MFFSINRSNQKILKVTIKILKELILVLWDMTG